MGDRRTTSSPARQLDEAIFDLAINLESELYLNCVGRYFVTYEIDTLIRENPKTKIIFSSS